VNLEDLDRSLKIITYSPKDVVAWRHLEPGHDYDVIAEHANTGDETMSERTFTYKVDELLAKIIENRDNHKNAFEAALKAYESKVVEVLADMLERARKGERVEHHIGLHMPQNMTKEYNQIIAMLEMTCEDEIDLTRREFCQYVLDQWHWKGQFAATASAYICEGDLPAYGRALETDE